jgi:hypothetical protein
MDQQLWRSANVLIGNSLTAQQPSNAIKCPLYSQDGLLLSQAFHELRFSTTGVFEVGSVQVGNDTIEPQFGHPTASLAVATVKGSDMMTPYLLVAGEAPVTGGTGWFQGVTEAKVRCKYKVAEVSGPPGLIACVFCIVILIRNRPAMG